MCISGYVDNSMQNQNEYVSQGAGGILIQKKGVLLVQPNYGPAKGDWILPGGMVSAGEHPHQAVVREFQEETGLETQVISLTAVRSRLHENAPANIYWVFEMALCSEGAIDLEKFHFTWDKNELMDVQLWDIDRAVSHERVRPLTRYFLSNFLKIPSRFSSASYGDDWIYSGT